MAGVEEKKQEEEEDEGRPAREKTRHEGIRGAMARLDSAVSANAVLWELRCAPLSLSSLSPARIFRKFKVQLRLLVVCAGCAFFLMRGCVSGLQEKKEKVCPGLSKIKRANADAAT